MGRIKYRDIVITDRHIEVPIEVWVKIVAEMEHFRQAYMDLFKWYRERAIPDFDFEQLFRKAIEVSKGEGQEDLYGEFSDSVRAKYEGSGESRERECSYCGATVIVIGKVSRPICMRCGEAANRIRIRYGEYCGRCVREARRS